MPEALWNGHFCTKSYLNQTGKKNINNVYIHKCVLLFKATESSDGIFANIFPGIFYSHGLNLKKYRQSKLKTLSGVYKAQQYRFNYKNTRITSAKEKLRWH